MAPVTATASPALHEIPETLVPREPRLGGSCVPVPERRLAALASTGPALLGRHDGTETVRFAASVVDELRQVLGVPAGYGCAVLAVPPGVVRRAVVLEEWAGALTVTGQGRTAARWREEVAARGGWPAAVAVPAAVGVVACEAAERDVRRAADRWVAADLSRMSAPLAGPAPDWFDVGFLCPSRLFGVPPGQTVVVLSERAVTAARSRHHALGDAAVFLPTLHALTTDGGTDGMTDLVLLAGAVRTRLESEPESFEAAVRERHALVAGWAATRDWADCAPRERGGDLTALIRTTLDAGVLTRLGAFLDEHHLGYGVVAAGEPGCLRLGLGDTVPLHDLERLLGLVDLLARRLTGGDPPSGGEPRGGGPR